MQGDSPEVIHSQVETARQALIQAAIQAYEEAGLAGLCGAGRFELALDAMKSLPLEGLVATNTEEGQHAS